MKSKKVTTNTTVSTPTTAASHTRKPGHSILLDVPTDSETYANMKYCYTQVKDGVSLHKVAKSLGLKKRSVQTYIAAYTRREGISKVGTKKHDKQKYCYIHLQKGESVASIAKALKLKKSTVLSYKSEFIKNVRYGGQKPLKPNKAKIASDPSSSSVTFDYGTKELYKDGRRLNFPTSTDSKAKPTVQQLQMENTKLKVLLSEILLKFCY